MKLAIASFSTAQGTAWIESLHVRNKERAFKAMRKRRVDNMQLAVLIDKSQKPNVITHLVSGGKIVGE